jgi:hypothetical protein
MSGRLAEQWGEDAASHKARHIAGILRERQSPDWRF